MTLFYYPPKPGPGGAPYPWGSPETWMEPVGGGGACPQSLGPGMQVALCRKKADPLGLSPVP